MMKTLPVHIPLKSIVFFLFVALLGAQSAPAALTEDGEPQTWQERKVVATAMAVALIPGVDNLYQLDPLNRPVGEVRLRELMYGRPFVCTSFDGAVYFGVEDGVDETGQPKYKAVASAQVPTDMKNAGIIFVPHHTMAGDDGTPDRYMVRVFDNGTKSFPKAGTLVINLLPTQIVLSIGGQKRIVEYRNAALIDEVSDLDEYNMAEVTFFYEKKGEWNILKQSRVRYLPDLRYTAIAYFNQKAKKPTIAFVRDSGNMRLSKREQAKLQSSNTSNR